MKWRIAGWTCWREPRLLRCRLFGCTRPAQEHRSASYWQAVFAIRDLGWSATERGNRARSDAEMISKTESALQELEETTSWMELLADAEIVKRDRLQDLLQEADELTAVLVISVKTLKARRKREL